MVYRLRSFHGGLGDELMLSTLPEMITKVGHEVYLLNDPYNSQVHSFRNKQIKSFVWDSNPFVKQGENGTGLWNCGDTLNLYQNPENNFIKNWEAVHGLKPTNNYPKIYINPKPVKDISGIIELSSISLKYNDAQVKWLVKCIMDQFPGFTFQQITSHNQSNRISIHNVANIESSSLWETWDILCSCKIFISLNSGTHSMAAAAKEYNKTMIHYCIMPVNEYASMMELNRFIYPGITYLREDEEF